MGALQRAHVLQALEAMLHRAASNAPLPSGRTQVQTPSASIARRTVLVVVRLAQVNVQRATTGQPQMRTARSAQQARTRRLLATAPRAQCVRAVAPGTRRPPAASLPTCAPSVRVATSETAVATALRWRWAARCATRTPPAARRLAQARVMRATTGQPQM